MMLGKHTRARRAANRVTLALATVAGAVLMAACAAVPPTVAPNGSASTTAAHGASPLAVPTVAEVMPSHSPAARPSQAKAVPSGKVPPSVQAPSAVTPPASVTGPLPSGTPAGARTVTFVNRTDQTIWVAASPDASAPLSATGWVLPVGQAVTTTVPNHWNGRFWGRTGCVFNSSGMGHCQTGDCGGRFQCTGWGTIPATLAEYDMDAWDGLDFYDVSMVDGSNLPMYINIAKGGSPDKISPDGCVPAGCTHPVDCPSALQVKAGTAVVGCISACARFGTDQYCCRGPWSSRAACDPAKWPVDYAAVFKTAEPYAYSYVDDDATSVFTCKGSCDYRITFGITP
jgi:Thaumatin family